MRDDSTNQYFSMFFGKTPGWMTRSLHDDSDMVCEQGRQIEWFENTKIQKNLEPFFVNRAKLGHGRVIVFLSQSLNE